MNKKELFTPKNDIGGIQTVRFLSSNQPICEKLQACRYLAIEDSWCITYTERQHNMIEQGMYKE
jgi:hypothetical protein